MPYKNIIYTKLKSELATDERFTEQLDDYGKLMYFSLLLLAGVKENKIPNDENYIKRLLNLQEKPEIIREKLDAVLKTFPKLVSANGYLKFKNYNKMHNPLGKSQGDTKVAPKDALYNIIKEYIIKKNYNPENNPTINNVLIKRNCKPAKELWLLANGNVEKIKEAINKLGDSFNSKGLSWSLETIEKWYMDFVSNKKQEIRMNTL